MGYGFDRIIDRHGTSCIKFDFAKQRGHTPDELSYWVADMDFRTAPEIIRALKKRADNGIFGYTDPDENYFNTVNRWLKKKYSYEAKYEWLSVTPGIVSAIAVAVQAYTEKGDAILINNPVYYPFAGTIKAAERKVVSCDLTWDGRTYQLNLDDFERKIVEEKPKLYLLCNPHNPGGKNWTKTELEYIGKICLKHGVVVLSDEIHADFTWDGKVHTVFASISKELEEITVTCTSPSKSFNIAGLQISNIFIASSELRRKFKNALDVIGYSQANIFGLEACKAAYEKGERWLDRVSAYISGNLEKSVEFLNERIPEIKVCKPEATYLLWLDCRGLGLTDAELNRKIRHEAKVWLDAGNIFGKPGEGFVRINVACSWKYLKKGLEAIVQVLSRN
ncbi:MalY/PatB family protein [Treponema sp.]|uniref:MalY/PatB family protein n=1 Tax=Treponema sp. TaxID=166 RepID=UPI00298D6205|nr:MalY/PatB family protein [Treponema sp.]MCQ2240079.1 pyridoxal phosphate-dependent aminotransferase [Treponema sp.]